MMPDSMNPLTRFVNKTEMHSLGSLARSFGWLFVVILFSLTARGLMLSTDEKLVAWGFQLAVAVLGGLGFASSVGAVNTRTIRKTSREQLEGEAKIEEAKGKAQVLTAEHAAIRAQTIQKVEVRNGSKESPQIPEGEEHEWADGDPKAGVI